ncbi:MAG TPA: helix-turn-helix domain-containing protein [Acidimicrobiales bacterium]|nr:helix-turn-helix domain-containing protein [Acidimicrobiales bacterium]
MDARADTNVVRVPHVEPLLLTADDVAATLAIGRTKVYELLASRALESVRIGTCRRIPVVALQRFVEALQADQNDDLGPGRRARGVTVGAYPEDLATDASRPRAW